MTIGEAMGFSGDEMIQAEISALFHDTGYVEGWKDHELRSARMAREFLKNAGIGEPLIHTVQNAILATHVPQSPTDRIGEALCDADLCHLAGEDYFEQMELLRLEWADSGQRDLSELDFHRNSVVFFGKHRYHSDYGKMVLGPMKMKNLDRIQERIRELEQAES